MAKAGQSGLEALTASLPRENKGPAARRAVESAILRRYRHEDRRRRHVVLSEDADRSAGFGQIVCIRPQAGRRQAFPGHAGREGRNCGRRCSVSRGRDEDVVRRRRARSSNSAPMSTTGSRRGRATHCASSCSRQTAALSRICMCAANCGRRSRVRCSMISLHLAKNAMSAARRCSVLCREASFLPWRKRARCGSLLDAGDA